MGSKGPLAYILYGSVNGSGACGVIFNSRQVNFRPGLFLILSFLSALHLGTSIVHRMTPRVL